MATHKRWAPAAVFLWIWFLLGIWVSGEYLYYAAVDEKDRLLHLVVASLGIFSILTVYFEWRRRTFAWGCLATCGVLASLYGVMLVLSVGEEFGPRFFSMSIGFVVLGVASIAVQILDWTFHR